jgi:hypothetical protein
VLTIIVLLIQSEEIFEFDYEEISIKVVKTPNGVSAKVNLRGCAAWGFNNLVGDFKGLLSEIIQKITTYNVKGRRELLMAYENGFHLLRGKGLWSPK